MTIEETTFALLDTETTRKEANDPRQEVIEVAVRLYEGSSGICEARYSSLIFPMGDVPPESSGIHHLTIEDLIGAPGRDVIDAYLSGFIPPEAIIVAHNAEFDSTVIDSQINGLGNNRWLCSERLAHHVFPSAPDFKLQTLRYAYGYRTVDLAGGAPHRADADVAVLERVFFRLIGEYRDFAEQQCDGDAGRLAKSEQIETLLRYAASPYVIETWPMGPAEAKGLPFARVDRGLLEWALKKADIRPDLRWNIVRELQRRHAA